MYRKNISVIGIYRSVCHLRQLVTQTSGIACGNITIGKLQYQLLFQLLVMLSFFLGQLYGIFGDYQFRHFQVIGGFHAYRDVGYFVIDPLLCIGQRSVGIHDISLIFIGQEVVVAILADESS